MAISFRAVSSGQTGLATSVDAPKPDGVTVDDVLVAVVGASASGSPQEHGAPTGWTKVRFDDEGVSYRQSVWYKVAGSSEPSSYTFTKNGTTAHMAVVIAAYTGVDTTGPIDVSGGATGQSDTLTAPSVTTTVESTRVIACAGTENAASWTAGPSGTAVRLLLDGVTNTYNVGLGLADYPQTLAEATGTKSFTVDKSTSRWAAQQVALVPKPNTPPDAPTQTNPVAGASIDRASTERFTWDFSDPDTGDSQSKFDLQIRPQGSAVLDVDVTEETPNEYHDLAGGTLTAGDYEWRVRTYDAEGAQGPWSGWEPFSAADTPDAPTITDPTSGQTIPTDPYTVEWSAAYQDAYQLRRVSDDSGSPDTSDVLLDTGTVASGSARARAVDFPDNNQWEHVQVRVERGGLWSSWDSVRVEVSYTAPAVPAATVVENDPTGAMSVLVNNGAWPVDVSTPVFTGTGDGDIVGPTATDGTTDSHDWEAVCVATAADGGTFDVSVDGTVVGQAEVGVEFTYEGLSFTITDGPIDYALGDTYTWSTTAVKVSSNEVWRRRVDDSGDGIRVAAEVTRGGSFADWAVASGVAYAFRLKAAGDNATSTWGAWTEEASEAQGLYGGGYPEES